MKIRRLHYISNFAAVVFALAVIWGGAARSQSCPVGFTYQTATADKDKCGYESFTDPDANGIEHWYLTDETVQAASLSYTYGEPPDATDSGGLSSDVVLVTAPTDCSESVASYSGSANETLSPFDEATYLINASAIGYVEGAGILWECTESDPYSSVSATNTDLEDCYLGDFLGPVEGGVDTLTQTQTSQINAYVYFSTGDYGYYQDDTFTVTETRSSEFTDLLLAKTINGLISLPSYSTNWSVGPSAGAASYSLDSAHYHGSGTELEYRLIIPCGNTKNAVYHCSWQEVTTDAAGNISSAKKSGSLVGTGDPTIPALGGIIIVPVPSKPSTITEENVVITSVDMPGGGGSSPGGGGSPPGTGGR